MRQAAGDPMRTSLVRKRVLWLAALGLCLLPIVAALSWRQIALRYHLYHLSHGVCPYRDSAFRFLLRWNGQDPDESIRVDEVVILAQEDGGNMLAILKPDDDEDDVVGERQVWLFDQESELIFTSEVEPGGFKDLTGDGIVELAIEGNWTIEDDRHFEVFLILPANQIMRPLLIVCCDEGDDSWWSWRPLPKGSTDTHNVEIGKGGKEDFAPSVTYRWSPEAGAYVGPKGGGGEPYVRLESWDELWTFLAGSN